MGNINSLNRTAPNAATLAYTYSGNQLTTVTKGGAAFRSYGYDNNGNATSDGQGNAFTYNMLNLPHEVPGKNMSYVYDAGGTKLRKISNGTITEYVAGIHYTGTAIDFIQTEEGRAIRSGNNYNYEYTLTDHLGNNRVTFDQTSGKVSEDDYYPFGLNAHVGPVVSPQNKYLYNKKELQEELTQYDYGARLYDPVIGRFTTVDALAEHPEQIYLSPYAYVGNNPISRTDPDGNCFPCLIFPEIVEGLAIIGEALGISTAVTANVTALTTGAIILNNLESGRSVNSSSLVVRRDATFVNTPVRIKPPVIVQARPQALPGSRPGKVFTPREKQKVKEKNKEENGGNTVCQGCGVNTTKPQKSQKGVTLPTTDTHVDHIDPKSNGGSGTAENGQVVCGGCNIEKSNKVPTPKPQGQ
ncbi:RHS repeat-associated protein [Mucilaginibacter sp. UYNi724]